jgi:hypothetical protein
MVNVISVGILGWVIATFLASAMEQVQVSPKKPLLPVVTFTDIAGQAGLNFRHNNAGTSEKYLIETMGAGCAWIDYNNDGLLDIYLVQSCNTPRYTAPTPLHSALYRNDGGGRFAEVTQNVGVGAEGLFGMGVAVGDYDNDGFSDFIVTGWNGAILYHNNKNGTFSEVTADAGIDQMGRFSNSAGWFDYDKDGYLDLFICNYVQWSPDTNQFCGERRPGGRTYCHPDNYPTDKNSLYHNNGDGTFTNVTERSGVAAAPGKALGVVLADFNNDGWSDIFVANDAWRNFLFINKGDGTFRDATYSSGVGFSQDGTLEAGMGADAADGNHDGWLDIYVTHLDRELNRYYLNQANGTFIDATYETALGNHRRIYSGFGTKFLDYDSDGYADIFVANGHILDNIHKINNEVSYAEPKLMYRNKDGIKFEEVSGTLGAAFISPRVSRGAAIGDFDNDGDLDILINNNGEAPQLLRCDIVHPNHWLALSLVGTRSNRDGIGCRVKVTAGSLTQYGQSCGGTSYCSSHDKRLFFGLGPNLRIDLIEVKWPSGVVDQARNLEADQVITITEAKSL